MAPYDENLLKPQLLSSTLSSTTSTATSPTSAAVSTTTTAIVDNPTNVGDLIILLPFNQLPNEFSSANFENIIAGLSPNDGINILEENHILLDDDLNINCCKYCLRTFTCKSILSFHIKQEHKQEKLREILSEKQIVIRLFDIGTR